MDGLSEGANVGSFVVGAFVGRLVVGEAEVGDEVLVHVVGDVVGNGVRWGELVVVGEDDDEFVLFSPCPPSITDAEVEPRVICEPTTPPVTAKIITNITPAKICPHFHCQLIIGCFFTGSVIFLISSIEALTW